jgi:hypothetical protein
VRVSVRQALMKLDSISTRWRQPAARVVGLPHQGILSEVEGRANGVVSGGVGDATQRLRGSLTGSCHPCLCARPWTAAPCPCCAWPLHLYSKEAQHSYSYNSNFQPNSALED